MMPTQFGAMRFAVVAPTFRTALKLMPTSCIASRNMLSIENRPDAPRVSASATKRGRTGAHLMPLCPTRALCTPGNGGTSLIGGLFAPIHGWPLATIPFSLARRSVWSIARKNAVVNVSLSCRFS